MLQLHMVMQCVNVSNDNWESTFDTPTLVVDLLCAMKVHCSIMMSLHMKLEPVRMTHQSNVLKIGAFKIL